LRTINLMSLLFCLGGCGGLSMEQANLHAAPNTGFMVKSVRFDGEERKYGLFVPHAYSAQTRWPVIVFLHGSMQEGNNGKSCMDVGLGPAVAKRAETFPFIVVFPQSPGDHWISEDRVRLIMACLGDVQRHYSTDPGRVVLTGLSDGGYGTWSVGAKYPERFSALVPMGSYTDFPDVPRLTSIPIWCFHNTGDFLVKASGTREMCRRIKEAGGRVKLTEYDAFGHDCWDRAYDEGDLFKWMLAQRREGSGVVLSPAAAAGTAAGLVIPPR
jgi:predicted peptidase